MKICYLTFLLSTVFYINLSFAMYPDGPDNSIIARPLAYSEGGRIKPIDIVYNDPQNGEVLEVPQRKTFGIVLPYYMNFGQGTLGWQIERTNELVNIMREKTVCKPKLFGNEAGSNIFIFSAATAAQMLKLRFWGQGRNEKRDITINIK